MGTDQNAWHGQIDLAPGKMNSRDRAPRIADTGDLVLGLGQRPLASTQRPTYSRRADSTIGSRAERPVPRALSNAGKAMRWPAARRSFASVRGLILLQRKACHGGHEVSSALQRA